jgi:hypothetical protein
MKYEEVVDSVPDYDRFLTVDELRLSSQELAGSHPSRVELRTIGYSAQGEPIEVVRIGNGPKVGLLIGAPDPWEQAGCMMLEYLSRRLAEDPALADQLGFTWYLVKCVDPDHMRLNEGWSQGPLSFEAFARHYFRPPWDQQVDWTYPVEHGALTFDRPRPETQAMMRLMGEVRPDWVYSLHNDIFTGVYFLVSGGNARLWSSLTQLTVTRGMGLHRGHTSLFYQEELAPAVYRLFSKADMYDLFKAAGGDDAAGSLHGGTSSWDYAHRLSHSFGLVCEPSYFYNPKLSDTGPSTRLLRDCLLEAIERDRRDLQYLHQQCSEVHDDIPAESPYLATIEDDLGYFARMLDVQEQKTRVDPLADRPASVAEEFSILEVGKYYYALPRLGMFIKGLEWAQKRGQGGAAIEDVRLRLEREFTRRSTELGDSLPYQVVPIRDLVRVQLGSGLLVADYIRGGSVNT